MSISSDCEYDFNLFKQKYNIIQENQDKTELFFLFKSVYAVNYLSSRIEVRQVFNNDFYKVTLSCIKESFMLYKDNYIRASSLVLRSAIENYIKFLLKLNQLPINNRIYAENYNLYKSFLSSSLDDKVNTKKSLLNLNDKLLSFYKRLSGLSHSLTQESKEFTVNFLEEIQNVTVKSQCDFLDIFAKFLNIVQQFDLFICTFSLKNWTTEHLNDLLKLTMGNKRKDRFFNLIKEGKDISFHY